MATGGDITLAMDIAMVPDIEIAVLEGRLDDALVAVERSEARAEELGVGTAFPVFYWARALIHLGRASDALPKFKIEDGPSQAGRALCLAHLGRYDEARAVRERFDDLGSDEDESGIHVLTNLLEAAILCGDAPTAAAVARRLAPLAPCPCAIVGVSYGRLLGGAAALDGEPDKSEAYYRQALEACELIRFRPETALVHLELAELQLKHFADERVEALDHLDFAISEFRDMKMLPSLQRALGHKGLLKA